MCCGKTSASGAGGRGFDLRPSHTKPLEMVVITTLLGVQGCGVRIKTAGVRINGLVVLVTLTRKTLGLN